ncbi:MAG: hypothetical protein AB1679_30450 [Actinomycetota bacterium]
MAADRFQIGERELFPGVVVARAIARHDRTHRCRSSEMPVPAAAGRTVTPVRVQQRSAEPLALGGHP